MMPTHLPGATWPCRPDLLWTGTWHNRLRSVDRPDPAPGIVSLLPFRAGAANFVVDGDGCIRSPAWAMTRWLPNWGPDVDGEGLHLIWTAHAASTSTTKAKAATKCALGSQKRRGSTRSPSAAPSSHVLLNRICAASLVPWRPHRGLKPCNRRSPPSPGNGTKNSGPSAAAGSRRHHEHHVPTDGLRPPQAPRMNTRPDPRDLWGPPHPQAILTAHGHPPTWSG